MPRGARVVWTSSESSLSAWVRRVEPDSTRLRTTRIECTYPTRRSQGIFALFAQPRPAPPQPAARPTRLDSTRPARPNVDPVGRPDTLWTGCAATQRYSTPRVAFLHLHLGAPRTMAQLPAPDAPAPRATSSASCGAGHSKRATGTSRTRRLPRRRGSLRHKPAASCCHGLATVPEEEGACSVLFLGLGPTGSSGQPAPCPRCAAAGVRVRTARRLLKMSGSDQPSSSEEGGSPSPQVCLCSREASRHA
jgi:hypothetical protein